MDNVTVKVNPDTCICTVPDHLAEKVKSLLGWPPVAESKPIEVSTRKRPEIPEIPALGTTPVPDAKKE
jgi:hypothetical protein